MTERAEPERPGPVARLLGSLANALIDLGLPTFREWLRERLGPRADVAQATTDGALVHLDGVRVPIGARGLLTLEHASAAVRRRLGLPELRLTSFDGVLTFGEGAFHANVAFTATPADPADDAAWIAGELAITDVRWSSQNEGAAAHPMHGRARLFVTSREWRLEEGALEGVTSQAHFAGSGVFEAAAGSEVPGERRPLVPRALSFARLLLARAKVGPFLDAASALVGRGVHLPPFVPLDAQLDGELTWSAGAGGTAELCVRSEVVQASIGGTCGPDGGGLSARMEADLGIAAFLRKAGARPEAIPRDGDRVQVVGTARGALLRPVVTGTIGSPELGFRLGRARFVPPTLLRDLRGELSLEDGNLVIDAAALAQRARVTFHADARIGTPRIGATLTTDPIEVAFVRDVLRTLGSTLRLPDDLESTIDLAIVPADGGWSVMGTVGLRTAASHVTLDVQSPRSAHATGAIAAADVRALGLDRGAVVPVEGRLSVDLEVALGAEGRPSARGTAASDAIALAVAARPELPPYLLEAITARVAIDRDAFVYEALRARAAGAELVARGTIPFDPHARPDAARLAVAIEDAGAELLAALAPLVTPRSLRLPTDLRAFGELGLFVHGRLTLDLTLDTPRGTTLRLAVGRTAAGVDGSTLRGAIALEDIVTTGVLGVQPPIAGEGLATVELVARDHAAIGWLSANRVRLAFESAPIELVDITARVHADRAGVVWNELEAGLAGGRLRSAGVVDRTGAGLARVALAAVAVHELPALGGRLPSAYVRGLLSGAASARFGAEGPPRAVGHVILDRAAFPVIERGRPTLERYGLRPPSEDAIAPVTAKLASKDGAVVVRDAGVRLHGATLRGEVTLSVERALAGTAEVALEEEYLRTSTLMTLPRVLTGRIVVPLRVEGTLSAPHVHAEIGSTLGHFLKDNRVSTFVSSAVEEAQIFFGKTPSSAPEVDAVADEEARAGGEIEAELAAAVEAKSSTWLALAARRASV